MQLLAMEPTTLKSLHDDTICAIATPHGIGGLATVRVSGPDAEPIVQRLWHGKPIAAMTSHSAHLGSISDDDGATLDEVVLTIFRAPRSFTGQTVIELSCHGSLFVQQRLLQRLIAAGARMAEPGEFTRRAFANGRLDLAQAEAVADVIASRTRAAHRLAISQMKGGISRRIEQLREQMLELAALLELELDFSEEDVSFADRSRLLALADEIHSIVTDLCNSFATGDALRNGLPVAIIGATNVGKSTLLNALLGDDRALVSDVHGTTRDVIEDTITIDGTLFRFIDTAGLRHTTDTVESMGIDRTIAKIEQARIVLLITDSPQSTATEVEQAVNAHLAPDAVVIRVINKIDLLPAAAQLQPDVVAISARQGTGLDTLRRRLVAVACDQLVATDDTVVTNLRHYNALRSTDTALSRAADALRSGISSEFVAQDLREAIHHLGTITGAITSPDILATIFARFCIGK